MPFRFDTPSGVFATVSGQATLTLQLAQTETLYSYYFNGNALEWTIQTSPNNSVWTVVDTRRITSVSPSIYTFNMPCPALYVRMVITKIAQVYNTARVLSLNFLDVYSRRLVPRLTQSVKYYMTENIGSVQPGITTTISISDRAPDFSSASVVRYIFPRSVTPEYIYLKSGTLQGVIFNTTKTKATLSSGSIVNSPLLADTVIDVYHTDGDGINIFDVNGSSLSDSAFVGGGGKEEFIQVDFVSSIQASSYYFKTNTPDKTKYPTWWTIHGYNVATSSWVLLDERKHNYTPYEEFSTSFSSTPQCTKYKMTIKAVSGDLGVNLVLFNVYDENGAEFIQSLRRIPSRTDAQITSSTFIDGSIVSGEMKIAFIVPVKVQRIIAQSVSGNWTVTDDTGTICTITSSGVTTIPVPRLSKTYTLTPPSGIGAKGIRDVELHGTRGRLNPFSSGLPQCFGGLALNANQQDVEIYLPTNTTLYGNHFQLTTTQDASIRAYTLRGLKPNGQDWEILNDVSYIQSSSLSGDFLSNTYSRYQLKIKEISPNTRGNTVSITEFTILSNTYTPITPLFTGENVPDVSHPEIPHSLHGKYTISTGAISLNTPYDYLFDRDPSHIFSTSSSSTMTLDLTFPYPTRIVACLLVGNPTSWSLATNPGNQLILSGQTGQTMIYAPSVIDCSGIRLTVSTTTGVPIQISDFRLFNTLGDFIPNLIFTLGTATSSRAQLLYGGTTTQPQTVTFTFPSSVSLQSVEWKGESLPSNVVASVTQSGAIIGSSDTFYGTCSVPLTFTGTKLTLAVNRLRATLSERYQNIRATDFILRDTNGYVITPITYGTVTPTGLTKVEYTVNTPSRTGYEFQNADPTAIITIQNATTFYGYRLNVSGARKWKVMSGATVLHTMTLGAPTMNTFTYIHPSTQNTPDGITLQILASFPGYATVGIGNLNILNAYQEPYIHRDSPFYVGGVNKKSDTLHGGYSGQHISFTYPSTTTLTKSIRMTVPGRVVVLATNDNGQTYNTLYSNSYLPNGTYIIVPDTKKDLFLGKSIIFDNNETVTIYFPKSIYISDVSFITGPRQPYPKVRINTIETLTRSVNTRYTVPLNTSCTYLEIRCTRIDTLSSLSMQLSDVLINGYSLGEFGVDEISHITYTVPNTMILTPNTKYKTYLIKCISLYNDKNSGDGSVLFTNTRVIAEEDLFSGFTENTKEIYGFNADDDSIVPTGGGIGQWIQYDFDAPTLIEYEGPFLADPVYSIPDTHVLQKYQNGRWVATVLPDTGTSFRRLIQTVKQFKKNGQIRIINWDFGGFIMSANAITKTFNLELSSFGTRVGRLKTTN